MQDASFKHVTNRQGALLAKKARENGVSREELGKFLNDPEKLEKFFSELKIDPVKTLKNFQELNEDDNWFKKLQSEASKIGARVHLLKVKVDYTKTHNEAAMAGGPQTGSDYNVLKVADLYQSQEKEKSEEIIILFSWIKGNGSNPKAIEWGLQNGLEKTVPHEVFAIGEQFPKLNYGLGPNPMYVVETTGCLFDGHNRACYVYWYNAERESYLRLQGRSGDERFWFAFRKKISPKDLETMVS